MTWWTGGGMWAEAEPSVEPKRNDDWRGWLGFIAFGALSYLVVGGERKLETSNVTLWWVLQSAAAAIFMVWTGATLLGVEEGVKLNGWKRLWLVLSILWIIPVGLLTIIGEAPSSANITNIADFNVRRRDFWRVFMLVTNVPPLLLFFVGAAFAWVRRGFRESKSVEP